MLSKIVVKTKKICEVDPFFVFLARFKSEGKTAASKRQSLACQKDMSFNYMEKQMRKVLFLVLSLFLTICIQTAVTQGQTRVNLSQLAGDWHNGTMSMISEVNITTGKSTPSNGSTFTYKFTANGNFEFIGLMNSTMYGCTTSLFNHKTGSVKISGTTLTFIPNKKYWKNTYSCSPKSNKERDYVLEEESYEVSFKQDEYGRRLICLADAQGKESCYREQKKND